MAVDKRNPKRLAVSNKAISDATRRRILKKLDAGQELTTKDFSDLGFSFDTFLVYARSSRAKQHAAEEKLAQRLRGASRNCPHPPTSNARGTTLQGKAKVTASKRNAKSQAQKIREAQRALEAQVKRAEFKVGTRLRSGKTSGQAEYDAEVKRAHARYEAKVAKIPGAGDPIDIASESGRKKKRKVTSNAKVKRWVGHRKPSYRRESDDWLNAFGAYVHAEGKHQYMILPVRQKGPSGRLPAKTYYKLLHGREGTKKHKRIGGLMTLADAKKAAKEHWTWGAPGSKRPPASSNAKGGKRSTVRRAPKAGDWRVVDHKSYIWGPGGYGPAAPGTDSGATWKYTYGNVRLVVEHVGKRYKWSAQVAGRFGAAITGDAAALRTAQSQAVAAAKKLHARPASSNRGKPKVRIKATRPGKLGGPGYLAKSDVARREILRQCAQEFGATSCTRSLIALAVWGKRRFSLAQKNKLARDLAYMRKTFGAAALRNGPITKNCSACARRMDELAGAA